jgi:glycosyltransferase involved in cell wall biosynthesis/2-polyprenyl-3-methyl-5-hydroxy-6-metoxy-1,4-benzoquinol methylase
MADERLHFSNGNRTPYHAFYAIQHLARYNLLQGKCGGKRVLDVACGEGFGSYLLAEWGAAEVVGVDLSGEAIGKARELFSHERVKFVQGNAESLDSALSGQAPFDVLACFETIEHISFPALFFEAAKRFLVPGALIVVSCPNDRCAVDHKGDNPFHVAEYTLEEFQRLTTGHLGAARQWLIGTPLSGMVNLDVSKERLLEPGIEMVDLTRTTAARGSMLAMAPAQANQAATLDNCLYFVGVWGDELPLTVAAAPVSYPAFIEPWALIEHLQAQQAETGAQLAKVQSALAKEAEGRSSLVAAIEQLSKLQTESEVELAGLRAELAKESAARSTLIATAAHDRAHAAGKQLADRQRIDALSAARAVASSEIALLEARCAKNGAGLEQAHAARASAEERHTADRNQIAILREWLPTYRWLFGHLRRRLFGRGIPILPRPDPDQRAAAMGAPTGEFDEDRILIEKSGLFDREYYGGRYSDLAGLDLLTHYLENGGMEGRSPGPDFDGHWYLSRNPDVARRRENPLVHYLRGGARDGQSPTPNPSVFATAAQVIEDVSSFEGAIATARPLQEMSKLQVVQGPRYTPLFDAWQLLFGSLAKPYDYIIFMPWLVRGGADLVAATAARATVERHGADAVLIVITDHDKVDAKSWLPPGVCVRTLSDFSPDLSHEDRVHIVEMLILALTPRAILNVNSRACWDAIKLRGRALGSMTQIFGFFFCWDYQADGRAAGYAETHFGTCFPYLTKAYFDNHAFAQTMIRQHGIPDSLASGVSVVKQPASAPSRSMDFQRADRAGRPVVLWAGRFCRQKNVDLLIEIAAQSPRFQFDVYGEGEGDFAERLRHAERQLQNFTLRGPYASFDSLPTNEYFCYLFTSLWEGLPTSLIAAGSLGLPIVASAVGGVPELVDDDTGWLVRDCSSPDLYINALEDIWKRPLEAVRRAEEMLDRVRCQHSWSAYMHAFSEAPSFLEGCAA